MQHNTKLSTGSYNLVNTCISKNGNSRQYLELFALCEGELFRLSMVRGPFSTSETDPSSLGGKVDVRRVDVEGRKVLSMSARYDTESFMSESNVIVETDDGFYNIRSRPSTSPILSKPMDIVKIFHLPAAAIQKSLAGTGGSRALYDESRICITDHRMHIMIHFEGNEPLGGERLFGTNMGDDNNHIIPVKGLKIHRILAFRDLCCACCEILLNTNSGKRLLRLDGWVGRRYVKYSMFSIPSFGDTHRFTTSVPYFEIVDPNTVKIGEIEGFVESTGS